MKSPPPSIEAHAVLRDLSISIDKLSRELALEYLNSTTEHDIGVVRAIFMHGLLLGMGFLPEGTRG